MNSSEGLVSVILPTFNRAGVLSRAIETVLSQTYHNWELVIVDDGSTDHTGELVRGFQAKEPRIQYLRKDHGGLTATRNAGLRVARGQYIALLDDDDLFLPDKLARQVGYMQRHPQLGFVYARVLVEHEDDRPAEFAPKRLSRQFVDLFAGGHMPQVASVLIRRSCLEQVELPPDDLRHCADLALWLNLGAKFPFDYIEDPVGVYCRHSGNMSRSLTTLLRDQIALLAGVKDWRRLGITDRVRSKRLAGLTYERARQHVFVSKHRDAAANFWRAVRFRADVGLLAREYRNRPKQSLGRRLIKPYLGLLVSAMRGLRNANR